MKGFERVKWHLERATLSKEVISFKYNAIDLILKLSIIWGKPNGDFRVFEDGHSSFVLLWTCL